MKFKTALVLSTLSLALVACQKQEAPKKAETTASTTAPATPVAFDLNSVPLSKIKLDPANFPYIKLPEGYVADTAAKFPALAKFPFFTQGSTQWVDGAKSLVQSFNAGEGKPFMVADVQKYFADEIQKLGGVQVSADAIPADVLANWEKEGVAKELLDKYKAEGVQAFTYLIRQETGNTWINLITDKTGGTYVVADQVDSAAATPAPTDKIEKPADKVEEKASEQPAENKALDSEALKTELAKDGKLELNVNFVVGKADVDASSKAQITEIANYLKANPEIKLEVNGHTDNTGKAEANKVLSENRAKAIVKALTAEGVSADRLKAQGFGDSQPIADNATAEGKLKNRRVELVVMK